MEFMDFFNSFMEDRHHHQTSPSEPPKMPNFFEVDKKKVGSLITFLSYLFNCIWIPEYIFITLSDNNIAD